MESSVKRKQKVPTRSWEMNKLMSPLQIVLVFEIPILGCAKTGIWMSRALRLGGRTMMVKGEAGRSMARMSQYVSRARSEDRLTKLSLPYFHFKATSFLSSIGLLQ